MIQICKEEKEIWIRAEKASIHYQSKMMEAIPWLLPFAWQSEKELVYQRGEGQTIMEWLNQERSENEILALLERYTSIQQELESYLMDQDKLLLDPGWIFWNDMTNELQFAYIPWDFPVEAAGTFYKRFARLLHLSSVEKRWEKERLVLLLHRMEIAVKQYENQPLNWKSWIQQEKQKMKESEEIKEKALDILTEKETIPEEKSWFQVLKQKFPFAIR